MRCELRIKDRRNAYVLTLAIIIGGGILSVFNSCTGRAVVTASPAAVPPPSLVDVNRPDNSWEVRFVGVRGRRLSRVYDPAYSAEEALAAFRNEYGPREVLCVARRSFAICDVIDRPPGK